jgi:LmbE family N-acetylglucosaminyl deacetylase
VSENGDPCGTAQPLNSRWDVYLSPHSDDVCFSLGSLAHKRHGGVLLTVFPITAYVAVRLGESRPGSDQVTAIRMSEDIAFTTACGLRAEFLKAMGASLLGRRPFDLGFADDNAKRIEAPLIGLLLQLAAERGQGARPWLFCPSGIGGHVDHVAIRLVMAQHYDRLAPLYRLAFYEDLPYASQPRARLTGLAELLRGLHGRNLRRHAWPLADKAPIKLSLIRLYESQFLEPPLSLDSFTPAAGSSVAPHEAVWIEELAGPM